MSLSICPTILSLLFHSMFLSMVDVWKLQYILYTSKDTSYDDARLDAKKMEQATIENIYEIFTKNNELEYLSDLLKNEDCCFSGGTVVEILHGKISQINNRDLDIFIRTKHNRNSKELYDILSKYGFVYTKEQLYKSFISYYGNIRSIPPEKIHPDFLKKIIPNKQDYNYSNFILFGEDIELLIANNDKKITNYVDVTVIQTSFLDMLDTFDINVCSSMIHFKEDSKQLTLYVECKHSHINKEMTGSLQLKTSRASSYFTNKKQTKKMIKKHLLRLQKYMDRGFTLFNKLQLYHFCLCMWQNNLVDIEFERLFLSLVERLTTYCIDTSAHIKKSLDVVHCILLPEYANVQIFTSTKKKRRLLFN